MLQGGSRHFTSFCQFLAGLGFGSGVGRTSLNATSFGLKKILKRAQKVSNAGKERNENVN